ncbi:MAG: glycosyltransferase family 2 protein [Rhodothermaceae bacterium]|nr:glycosyltransferase family 2 protein [Rhodothermaceae bacterium]
MQNQKPASTYRPTLSLCMIVKNEEENLEKCLSLARPHVDEIVVVDTGSTDGTVDIAKRYADVFEEIEWPGSFSVARNHSLELASGDYILILDGDEYIDSQEAWKKIRNSLGVLDIAALVLPVKNLLSENNVVSADMFWQERVLRNHPDIRYHGSVHNQVMESIWAHAEQTGRHIARLDAEIIHTGYSLPEEEMVQKYETRVELLKAEYENPRDEVYRAYYAYQLGLIYYIMRRNEAAAELFNSLDYDKLTPENAFYTRLLGAQTAQRLNDMDSALVHCNEMLRINPKEPVGYYLTGVSLMRSSFFKDGLLMLLQAYNVNNDADQFIRFVINPKILLEHLIIACRSLHLSEHVKIFEDLLKEEDCESDKVKGAIRMLQVLLAQNESEPLEKV